MNFIFDPSLILYLPLHGQDGVSFMSKDAFGRTCTVTGALWRPNGCYFDGVDDQISCGTIAIPASPTTYCAWGNAPSGWGGRILNVTDGDTKYRNWTISTNPSLKKSMNCYDGTNAVYATTALDDGKWHFLTIIYQTNNVQFFIDGDPDAVSSGSTFVLHAMSVSVAVSSSGASWKGMIGEVMIYNRALLPVEIHHNYLATKWRYR